MDPLRPSRMPGHANVAFPATTKAPGLRGKVAAPSGPARTQASCAGSGRQMGGMWQTNRFFVRRQFS